MEETPQQTSFRILSFCNDLLEADRFAELDSVLPKLDVENFTSQECCSWLTGTYLPTILRHKLRNRDDLFKRCYSRLVELKGEAYAKRLTYYKQHYPPKIEPTETGWASRRIVDNYHVEVTHYTI